MKGFALLTPLQPVGMKGVPMKAKKVSRAMPFKISTDRSQPRSFKQKQLSWTLNGLRAMKAPWAGVAKSNSCSLLDSFPLTSHVPHCFDDEAHEAVQCQNSL